jgi:3-oxo-5-alpha-steroid 4-dehydrogenase 1
MSYETYQYILWAWIGVGVLSFPFLLKQTAPYGRHTSSSWGPMISNQLGWMIMEGVAPFFMSFWFWTGSGKHNAVTYFLYALYMAHYVYRGWIYPWMTNTSDKKMPLAICGSAVVFNLCNTFIIGFFLSNFSAYDTSTYFQSVPFFIGIVVFVTGVFINIKSDFLLIHLRQPGETGYKIPNGFLFKWVSCPNHFGEIVEWLGFAILFGALPGWSFALWTVVNLVPRTLDHHRWYKAKFANYPPERKAVIPFLI